MSIKISKMKHFCQDYATDACPCILSELKECYVCSHLQGHELCNCDWQGSCVFLMYRGKSTHIDKNAKHVQILKTTLISTSSIVIHCYIPNWEEKNLIPLYTYLFTFHYKSSFLKIPAVLLKDYGEGIFSFAVYSRTPADLYVFTHNTVPLKITASKEQIIWGVGPLRQAKNASILILAQDFGSLLAKATWEQLNQNNTVTIAIPKEQLLSIPPNLQPPEEDIQIITHDNLNELISNVDYDYLCCFVTQAMQKKVLKILSTLEKNIKITSLNI